MRDQKGVTAQSWETQRNAFYEEGNVEFAEIIIHGLAFGEHVVPVDFGVAVGIFLLRCGPSRGNPLVQTQAESDGAAHKGFSASSFAGRRPLAIAVGSGRGINNNGANGGSRTHNPGFTKAVLCH